MPPHPDQDGIENVGFYTHSQNWFLHLPHLLLKKIKSCVFVLLLVYCLFIPPSRKNKVWIEYEGTRENIPQMFCTYIRIEWKILVFRKTAFHTFPKSVYPTPLLTLKQRPNGAQTPAVFLYFSILNSLPTKKTSLFLSLQGLTDYDNILLEIYKAASCLFCKWNDEMHKQDHCCDS